MMSEKILRKSFVIFMAVALAVSFMPAVFAQNTGIETTSSIADATVTATETTRASSVDDRLRQCVAFLSQNNPDERPAVICSRILKREMDCVQYMKSRNVVNPASKCDALLIGAVPGANIAVTAQDSVRADADWRIMAAKRITSEYKGSDKFIEGLDEDKSKIFVRLSRTEQKKILEMDDRDRIKTLNKYTIQPVKKEMGLNKRVISKSKLEQAKQKYERAKNEYERTNKLYNQKKNQFLEAKNKLKECEGQDTEECDQLREQAQEHAKDYIINGAMMAIEHLNKIKSTVESAEGMDEETASEIIAEIDEAIAELEAAIEKVKGAKTKEEVQEGAKEISKVWGEMKHAQKVHAARVINSGMWNIIKKSEQVIERLEHALQKMDEKGIDVENVDEMVVELYEKISNATSKYDESEELLDQARELKSEDPSDENIRDLVNEARMKLQDAHNDIKDAYQLLPKIIREIHASGGIITSSDEDEFEVVEIENDDEDENEVEEDVASDTKYNETELDEADDIE